MRPRRLRASAIAVVLVASACSADGASPAADTSTGDASAFCLGWPAARAALQDDLGNTNNDWEIRGNVEVARLALDEADARVPAVLRSDWTSASKFQDTVITLLEIVDYTPERLPVQLIDAAFGVGGVDAAAAASASSIEVIDAWALEECGDFCELWPRLDRALGWVGEGHGNTHESIRSGGQQDKATILSADALVPAAVRDFWDEVSALKLRLVEFFTSDDIDELENEERDRRMSEALGFLLHEDRGYDFEPLAEQFGEPPPEIDWRWWFASRSRDEHLGRIDSWVADNCESVGVAGLPGTIHVEDPGRSPDRLLIAVMPVGTDLGEIEDASDFLAVACSQQRPGEVWSSPLIGRTAGFDQPCIDLYREDIGARPALLPAGTYDLFIGSFPLGVGNFNTYVPAPERCAVLSVTVDGDTEVALPDLGLCNLGPLAGTAEEIARRQPLPDTGGPSGTLRVTLTEHLSSDGIHVNYMLAVLHAGTTLNQLALGDAWPVGSGCLNVDRPIGADLEEPDSSHLADLDQWERQEEQEAADRRTFGEELERRAAELQEQREDVERQLAELGNLSEAERAEAEAQLWDEEQQIGQEEQQLAQQRVELEEWERGAEEGALQRQQEREQVEEAQQQYLSVLEAITDGIPVPITPFPADPQDQGCSGGPWEYLGLNDDGWVGPDLAVLPAGDYDVYVFVDLWNPEQEESQNLCARLTASVSGEAVVKAPPLGDCP